MREIRPSGLKRGEETVSLSLPYSTAGLGRRKWVRFAPDLDGENGFVLVRQAKPG